MKILKFGLIALSLLATSVSAKEAPKNAKSEAKKASIFVVDKDFKTNVVDTIPCGSDKMESYEDAREWFSSSEWDSYRMFNEVSPESFDFTITHNTKVRWNVMINTQYVDYIKCAGNVSFYDGFAVISFNDIQLGEKVIGLGQKDSMKPLTHKVRKKEKLEKEKAELEADMTMKAKEKKNRIEDVQDEIDDIDSTLEKVQEEIEKRVAKLYKALK